MNHNLWFIMISHLRDGNVKLSKLLEYAKIKDLSLLIFISFIYNCNLDRKRWVENGYFMSKIVIFEFHRVSETGYYHKNRFLDFRQVFVFKNIIFLRKSGRKFWTNSNESSRCDILNFRRKVMVKCKIEFEKIWTQHFELR